MNDLQTDCKCECANCGAVIEYRSTQAGETVQCAACGQRSTLPDPVKLMMLEVQGPSTPEFKSCEGCGLLIRFWEPVCLTCEVKRRKRIFRQRVAISLSAVVLLTAGGIAWRLTRPKPVPPPKAPTIFLAQPQARLPKSINDLRPVNFVLERSRGDTNSVAVGDIRNDSLNVHHHVRADVDVLDSSGVKIATVSDYFTDLGGNQSWHFNVLVTDPKAASVRFAGFKEDE